MHIPARGAARHPAFRSGLILGILLFTAFAAQTVGLQYTTPSKNAFLSSTSVIMVPFFYWIIQKTRPDASSFAGAVVALIGMAFLTLSEGLSGFTIGDGLTLLCAGLFALQIVYNGYAARKYSPVQLNFVQMAVAAILSIVLALFEGAPLRFSGQGVFSVLYLGIMSTTLAYMVQSVGLKYTTTTRAAIILSMESVFGSIFSVLFTGETLTPQMVLGSALMVAAILLAETKFKFRRAQSPKKEHP